MSLALETDLAIAAIHGRVVDRGDCIAVESPREPSAFEGNALVLPAPPAAGSIARWIDRFAAELPALRHVALRWAGDPGPLDELVAAGFAIDRFAVLTAAPHEIAARSAPLPIRALSADEVPATAELAFAVGDHHDEARRAFTERRAAGQRELALRGLAAFYGAFDGARLVASLGLVPLGALARFQDVQVLPAHRRRGLASALLATAAAASDPAARLVLVAGAGSDAERIYTRAGFRTVEHAVSAWRAPSEPASR